MVKAQFYWSYCRKKCVCRSSGDTRGEVIDKPSEEGFHPIITLNPIPLPSLFQATHLTVAAQKSFVARYASKSFLAHRSIVRLF